MSVEFFDKENPMRVQYDKEKEVILLIFTFRHFPMAKEVLKHAIELYRETGADVAELESLLWIFDDLPTIQ